MKVVWRLASFFFKGGKLIVELKLGVEFMPLI